MRIPINGYWLKPLNFPFALLLTLISGATPRLSAAPAVIAVLNAASYKDSRLPGSTISPGSIFIVTGSGLGPANIAVAPGPFQSTSLSGTSVAVTVNGKTVNALMYYTSATQIAALLPSSTPTGGLGTANPNAPVSITVTYNGVDSPPTPFQGVSIVGAGLFTVDSSGTGPAIVTYPDYSLVSAVRTTNCGGPSTACGSANAGDILTLWATGLGPVPGGDGPSSLGQSIPNLPLTVWVGGVQAPIIYQGRSGCCIGLDEIVFTVPANLPAGCAVPLVVQFGTNVSNSTAIPVTNGSRTCTPADPTVAAANIEQWASLPSPTLGIAQADVFPTAPSGGTERARFTFVRASIPPALQPFLVSYLDPPPPGTCAVSPYHDIFTAGTGFPIEMFLSKLSTVPIDSGSHFTFTGPKGTTASVTSSGDWVVFNDPTDALIGSKYAGSYIFAGGSGNDVGAFTTQLTAPLAPAFTSPPPGVDDGVVVTRRLGMNVAWSPSGATGPMPMILSAAIGSPTDQGNLIYTAANCTVLASVGTFTIPAYALLALPSTGGFLTFGPGDLRPLASGVFSASGLNLGIAQVTYMLISDQNPQGIHLQ
jgi:uncharacterized protein (TIGR03437 family)